MTEVADPSDLVAALCGHVPSRITAAAGGGNNQLFRVEFAEGAPRALKLYLGEGADRRLAAEFKGLQFLHRQGVRAIPAPLAADWLAGAALYDWIEGSPVIAPSDVDVLTLADLLLSMQQGRDDEGAKDLPLASAACLSATDLYDQFHNRLARLRLATPDEIELRGFLDQALLPCFQRAWQEASNGFASMEMDVGQRLTQTQLALSPSDFGFHNALRKADGSLVFVDFEYFGWDDPVKAVSDICWHAGMELDDRHVALFLERVTPFFAAADKCFSVRLKLLYPLLGLIWCLIMLNEFLPDRWQRRAAAGRGGDWETAKARQLHRARLLLNRVEAFR